VLLVSGGGLDAHLSLKEFDLLVFSNGVEGEYSSLRYEIYIFPLRFDPSGKYA
jgi:hypothetical protein